MQQPSVHFEPSFAGPLRWLGLVAGVSAVLALSTVPLGAMAQPAGARTEPFAPARAVAGAPSPAESSGAVWFVLLDRELHATPAMVSSITLRADAPGEIRTVDDRGPERRRSFQELSAVAPGGFARRSSEESMDDTELPDERGSIPRGRATAGWIELTDGQILSGTFDRADESGEQIEWTSARAGSFRFSLDRIRRMASASASSDGLVGSKILDDGVSDVLRLNNGDVLRGFVERISTNASGLSLIHLESEGRSTQIPYGSVAEMVLQSPNAPASRTAAMTGVGQDRPIARVRLSDGSSLLAGGISTVRSIGGPVRLSLSVPSLRSASIADPTSDVSSVMVDLADVCSIVPLTSRLVALSACPIVRHEPTADRRRAMPVRTPALAPAVAAMTLGAAPISLDGPCVVEWVVDTEVLGTGQRASHVSGRVSLLAGASPWGDCRVRLEWLNDGETAAQRAVVLAEARLTSDRPWVELNAPIPSVSTGARAAPASQPARLRLTVEAGAFGPVRDGVVLEEFLILMRNG